MDNKPAPSSARQLKCPHCGRLAIYSTANPYRPFCSERCRLIDLGRWADEDYRVPEEESSSFTLNESSVDDGEE